MLQFILAHRIFLFADHNSMRGAGKNCLITAAWQHKRDENIAAVFCALFLMHAEMLKAKGPANM
jgi:hypothetical protein